MLTGPEFVGGEARTLLRVLAGGPALPPGRRSHATSDGYLVSNVETFAQTAVLHPHRRSRVRRHRHAARTGDGTAERRRRGRPPGCGRGAARHAAGHRVARSGRGRCRVRRRRAATTAGGCGRRPTFPLSRAGIAAAGASLGAGVLFVLDSTTCALGELARVTAWLAAQSARSVRAVPLRAARPCRGRRRRRSRRSARSDRRAAARDARHRPWRVRASGRHRAFRGVRPRRPARRDRRAPRAAAVAGSTAASYPPERSDERTDPRDRLDPMRRARPVRRRSSPTASSWTSGDSRSSAARPCNDAELHRHPARSRHVPGARPSPAVAVSAPDTASAVHAPVEIDRRRDRRPGLQRRDRSRTERATVAMPISPRTSPSAP